MLRSAVLRLTVSYLAIIMVLSISFSVVLYGISSSELDRGFRHQSPYYGRLVPPSGLPDFTQFREEELAAGQANLRSDLIAFNLGVLLLGGAASYALARRTLKPIEEAMEAQSRFTADASHELRTPLTAMQSEIEVALRDRSLTKQDARQLLESNLEEVGKLRALADGLLRLASVDAGELPTEPVWLDKATSEALRRVAAAAKAKRITIVNKVEHVAVAGDPPSIAELSVILLDNAIKYSKTGGSVTVTTHTQAKHVQLSVADTGHGIKAIELPHIFDRFYRADPARSKERVAGYGLGLSIARQIAQLHHGSIEAASTPGQGSTFTVRLPRADA
jgi:signal transduction histidine kinase